MMKIRWSIIVLVLSFNLVRCKQELELTKGLIKGRILESREGRSYYSYTGIPYAKPPIGELRFKAPKPVEPWNGTLDVTKESNICIQQGSKVGHEDCLYLNVYSPKTQAKLLPVLIWIHGGGFTWGHSSSGLYGPEYFMDKNLVVVTINYRLGILGFLSTEDDVIPGNYGMKDQVEALRWVRENIIKFNGNPNLVTLVGGSAGAACAGLHMLSPMSKGLFHKSILQSGTPVCKFAVSALGVARKRAHTVATIAGCNFDSSEDVLNCLRQLSAPYLMDVHSKLFSWINQPNVLFNPVVENCNSGHEAFLCRHPIYNFKQESFVPAIVGLNSAEGGLCVASLYNITSLVHPEFRTYFNRLFSIMSYYNHYIGPDHIEKIGEKVFKKYFPSGRIDDNTHSNAVKMFTDSIFTQCTFDMAYRLSSPVYTYLYDYQNEFSYNTLFGPCEKPLGVTHGDELTSLFKKIDVNPNDLNEEDFKVSKLMVNVWYKFVASDNPTTDGLENGLPWPKFTQSNQSVLHLSSSHPNYIKNPFIDDYDFWNKLIPMN